MAMSFELQENWSLDALAAQWQALEERADASFFLTWDWIGTWLAVGGLKPALLIGRRGGEVVLLGLLAPARRKEMIFAAEGLHLHATGNQQQDVVTIEYNGFLVDRAASGEAERGALAFLLDGVAVGGKRRDELYLRGVTEDFHRHVPEGGRLERILARMPSWRVDLQAVRDAGKPYVQTLGSNTRHQIRRSLRLYEAAGPVALTRAGTLDEARAFMQGLKALHQPYWTARGKPGAFANPHFARFHQALIARALPRGEAVLLRVEAGEQLVGYLYNFRLGGRECAYQSGFAYGAAPPHGKPGLTCHHAAIARARAEGVASYDFLAGEDRYKRSLATGTARLHWLEAAPRGRPSAVMLRLRRMI